MSLGCLNSLSCHSDKLTWHLLSIYYLPATVLKRLKPPSLPSEEDAQMRNLRPRPRGWEMAELEFGLRGSELGAHHTVNQHTTDPLRRVGSLPHRDVEISSVSF